MTVYDKVLNIISEADALLIGVSNGLSISEGYHIFADNEMFRNQFGDFRTMYGIKNVIEGCFFRYPDNEHKNEFFRRLVSFWIKDYVPSKVMKDLLTLVGDKDYFIVTSNGDRHLELSGFDPSRIFEIEGNFETAFSHIDDKSRELSEFISKYHNRKIVILELGIGMRNRLIKQPLMQLASKEPYSSYITFNLAHEIYIPQEIAEKSVAVTGDITVSMNNLCSIKI